MNNKRMCVHCAAVLLLCFARVSSSFKFKNDQFTLFAQIVLSTNYRSFHSNGDNDNFLSAFNSDSSFSLTLVAPVPKTRIVGIVKTCCCLRRRTNLPWDDCTISIIILWIRHERFIRISLAEKKHENLSINTKRFLPRTFCTSQSYRVCITHWTQLIQCGTCAYNRRCDKVLLLDSFSVADL